jgi:hypothetical protein
MHQLSAIFIKCKRAFKMPTWSEGTINIRLAWKRFGEKHSSLFVMSISDGEKSFRGQYHKTYYRCNEKLVRLLKPVKSDWQ